PASRFCLLPSFTHLVRVRYNSVPSIHSLIHGRVFVADRTRVLITGAAGRIGSFLTRHLANQYDFVLTDVRPPADTCGFPFIAADISHLDAMRALCSDIDTVVHLAADPSTAATWESLLPRNIVGVQNIFQAAHESGCRRVIFASSVNAVAGYPREVQVH